MMFYDNELYLKVLVLNFLQTKTPLLLTLLDLCQSLEVDKTKFICFGVCCFVCLLQVMFCLFEDFEFMFSSGTNKTKHVSK